MSRERERSARRRETWVEWCGEGESRAEADLRVEGCGRGVGGWGSYLQEGGDAMAMAMMETGVGDTGTEFSVSGPELLILGRATGPGRGSDREPAGQAEPLPPPTELPLLPLHPCPSTHLPFSSTSEDQEIVGEGPGMRSWEWG